jgi:hypothetical protein
MKRSNSLIADFPPPAPPWPDRPAEIEAAPKVASPPAANPTAANPSRANLAGFSARRQRPHRIPATVSVAPFYVETEAA